ncbi:hypothetical protein RYH80_18510 [Halobaculum sp. MBLA0147]|uniref:hypothetical protein n=1 Tax=Halobaculum sp. MBLA0147 TaxID=3079934 RepID=UPI0035243D41
MIELNLEDVDSFHIELILTTVFFCLALFAIGAFVGGDITIFFKWLALFTPPLLLILAMFYITPSNNFGGGGWNQ